MDYSKRINICKAAYMLRTTPFLEKAGTPHALQEQNINTCQ